MRLSPFIICVTVIVVAGITFFLYLPSLGNGFVNFDDYGYILQNPAIRALNVDLLRYAFGDFHFQFYIPLTWLSFAVDHYFWRLNPRGYHLTNNLLHALNAGWVTLLAMKLHQSYRKVSVQDAGNSPSLSLNLLAVGLSAGLMFSLHPLRVESVAWATERKDVLSTFFALSALLAYVKWTSWKLLIPGGGAGSWRIAAVILYLCSLLSKPMMITMPFVLLLLDWFPLRRIRQMKDLYPAIREKTLFFLLSLIATIIVLLSQLADGITLVQVPLLSRIALALRSIVEYLRMMVWPSGLVPLYPHPGSQASFALPEYLLSLIAVGGISLVAVWRVARGERWLLATWCYFLITLLPVLGITQVGPQAMADRFTYVPVIMPTILAASLIWTSPFRLPRAGGVKLVALLLLVLLVSWGKITRDLIGVWRDSETLWTRVILLRPMQSADSYHHRGFFYADRGEHLRALEDLTTCIDVSKNRQPHNLSDAYAGRGDILMKMGRFSEAYEDFRAAITASAKPAPQLYLWRDMALKLSRVP